MEGLRRAAARALSPMLGSSGSGRNMHHAISERRARLWWHACCALPPRAHRHWEGRKARPIYRHYDHAAPRTTRAETSDPKVVNRRLDPRILYTARYGTRGGRAAYPFCATAGIWAWLNYAGADPTDFFWVFRFAAWFFISS
jgi:hypothetical protein